MNWILTLVAGTSLGAGLSLESLELDKVFYRPSETARFKITLVNAQDKPQSATVTAHVLSQVEELYPLALERIDLEPGQRRQETYVLGCRSLQFGHEVVFQLMQAGQVVAERRAFFGVAGSPFALGRAARLTGVSSNEYAAQLRRRLLPVVILDDWNGNQFTLHGSSTATAFGVVQATQQPLRGFTSACRQAGISVLARVPSYTTDNELLRRRPEWGVYDKSGAALGTYQTPRQAGRTNYFRLNTARMDTTEFAARQVISAARQWGLQGVLFDRGWRPVSLQGKHDVQGRSLEFTETITVQRLRQLRDLLTARNPRRLTLGFEMGWQDEGAQAPLEFGERARGGNLMLASNAWQQATTWDQLTDWLLRERKGAELANLFIGPVSGTGTSYRNRLTALCLATGLGVYEDGHHPTSPTLGTLAFRYSSFLYHPDLEQVTDLQDIAVANAGGTLWRPFVRQLPQPHDRTALVLHLVSPPAQNTIDPADGASEQPANGVTVKLRLPHNHEWTSLWCLRPMPDGSVNVTKLKTSKAGDRWHSARLPTFTTYALVIATHGPAPHLGPGSPPPEARHQSQDSSPNA